MMDGSIYRSGPVRCEMRKFDNLLILKIFNISYFCRLQSCMGIQVAIVISPFRRHKTLKLLEFLPLCRQASALDFEQ